MNIQHYVTNACGDLVSLQAGGVAWPVSVGAVHDMASPTWLTSLSSALIGTPRDEMQHTPGPRWKKTLSTFGLDLAERAAVLAGIDRAVMVNNALLSVSPVGPSWLAALSTALMAATERWPDRIVLARGVIADEAQIRSAMAHVGGFIIPNRVSYVYDLRAGKTPAKINAVRDVALLRKAAQTILSPVSFDAADLDAAHAQYTAVYIDRHGARNPQFTRAYFQEMFESRQVGFWGLKQGATLTAFLGLRDHGDFWSAPLIGYDTTADQKDGLYRQIFALGLIAAAAHKAIINFGAGAGHYKKLRGATSVVEYMIVLPPRDTWLGRILNVALRASEEPLGRVVPQMIAAHGG